MFGSSLNALINRLFIISVILIIIYLVYHVTIRRKKENFKVEGFGGKGSVSGNSSSGIGSTSSGIGSTGSGDGMSSVDNARQRSNNAFSTGSIGGDSMKLGSGSGTGTGTGSGNVQQATANLALSQTAQNLLSNQGSNATSSNGTNSNTQQMGSLVGSDNSLLSDDNTLHAKINMDIYLYPGDEDSTSQGQGLSQGQGTSQGQSTSGGQSTTNLSSQRAWLSHATGDGAYGDGTSPSWIYNDTDQTSYGVPAGASAYSSANTGSLLSNTGGGSNQSSNASQSTNGNGTNSSCDTSKWISGGCSSITQSSGATKNPNTVSLPITWINEFDQGWARQPGAQNGQKGKVENGVLTVMTGDATWSGRVASLETLQFFQDAASDTATLQFDVNFSGVAGACTTATMYFTNPYGSGCVCSDDGGWSYNDAGGSKCSDNSYCPGTGGVGEEMDLFEMNTANGDLQMTSHGMNDYNGKCVIGSIADLGATDWTKSTYTMEYIFSPSGKLVLNIYDAQGTPKASNVIDNFF